MPTWKYFGTKTIMRDHLLMIEQFERMQILRKIKRQQLENQERENGRHQDSAKIGQSGYKPYFQNRSSNVQSVL